MNLQTFALHDCGAAPKRNFCTNYCPYTERERERSFKWYVPL